MVVADEEAVGDVDDRGVAVAVGLIVLDKIAMIGKRVQMSVRGSSAGRVKAPAVVAADRAEERRALWAVPCFDRSVHGGESQRVEYGCGVCADTLDAHRGVGGGKAEIRLGF